MQPDPLPFKARLAYLRGYDRHEFEQQLDGLLRELCPGWPAPSDDDARFVQSVRIRRKRARVRRLLDTSAQVAGPIAEQLMEAVLHDSNPSFNRLLIEPLLRGVPTRTVLHRLVDVIETGPRRRKICAANAAYWAWAFGVRAHDLDEFDDIAARLRIVCLTVFVEVDDLGVRQALDTWITLDPSAYRTNQHALLGRARRIAEADPANFTALLLCSAPPARAALPAQV